MWQHLRPDDTSLLLCVIRAEDVVALFFGAALVPGHPTCRLLTDKVSTCITPQLGPNLHHRLQVKIRIELFILVRMVYCRWYAGRLPHRSLLSTL